MPTSMLVSLLVSLVAFTVLYLVLMVFRTRLELARADLRALRRRTLERAA
jgi:hypothetical protein